MRAEDLLPVAQRPDRLLLLDLLAGRPPRNDTIDPAALERIIPPPLLPFVYWRLHTRSSPQAAHFAGHYRQSCFDYLRRTAELRRIAEVLRGAAIEFVVLKGPVIASMVYPNPATRTMSDIDLLVRDEDVAGATTALGTLGYAVLEQCYGGTSRDGEPPPLARREEPGLPILELHTMLDSAPDDREALEAAWASVRPVTLHGDFSVPALGRSELFAHVVAHASRHHRFERQLRSLLDIALILGSAEGEIDWESQLPEWRRRGIDAWMALTLALGHTLLDIPFPPALAGQWPSDDVLLLAAEQLWSRKEDRVPGTVSVVVTGRHPAPMHRHTSGYRVPYPRGAAGIRLRLRKQWRRLAKAVTLVRRMAVSPRVVAREIALFGKREQLFALIEGQRDSPRRR